MFGIPVPPLRERMDRFEAGARAIRAFWRGTPVTLEQPYTPLVDAQSFPLPPAGGLSSAWSPRGRSLPTCLVTSTLARPMRRTS